MCVCMYACTCVYVCTYMCEGVCMYVRVCTISGCQDHTNAKAALLMKPKFENSWHEQRCTYVICVRELMLN